MKFMATLQGYVCSVHICNKKHLCKQRSLGTSSLTSDVLEDSKNLFRGKYLSSHHISITHTYYVHTDTQCCKVTKTEWKLNDMN